MASWLPSVGYGMYNSPDETANAVVAEQIAVHSVGTIETATDAEDFLWVHPRSWVGLPGKIVPVGFFGWPVLLALLRRLLGLWLLPWVGGLLLVSSIIPFYLSLRKWFGTGASAVGVLIAFSFPTMIVYANRGLFSNGPVLAFGLWTFWLLLRRGERGWNARLAFVTGLLAGITLSIRPIEAIWIVPWWAWAWAYHANRETWNARRFRLYVSSYTFLFGFLLGVVPSMLLAWNAYGSPFVIGYWLRETSPVVRDAAISASPAAISLFPFGFHPRNAWWNVRSFLFWLTWPWVALIVFAVFRRIGSWRKMTRPFDREHLPVVCAGWTVAWLLFLYGSGLYADHVRVGAVTIGNSFLRYLLPLALLAGWAGAWFVPRMRSPSMRIALVVGFVLFGGWRAFAADDEGLYFTRRELRRYAHIRQETVALLPADAVVFSARSDKIFFPVFRAVSPLPRKEEIARFAAASRVPLALFARPLSQREKDDWMRVGLEPQELSPFGRETLYRLFLR